MCSLVYRNECLGLSLPSSPSESGTKPKAVHLAAFPPPPAKSPSVFAPLPSPFLWVQWNLTQSSYSKGGPVPREQSRWRAGLCRGPVPKSGTGHARPPSQVPTGIYRAQHGATLTQEHQPSACCPKEESLHLFLLSTNS